MQIDKYCCAVPNSIIIEYHIVNYTDNIEHRQLTETSSQVKIAELTDGNV